MAALDLEELVPDLVSELSAPGSDSYDGVSNDEWVGRLRNAFWDAHLNGFMDGWTEHEGMIMPSKGSDGTIPRDLQFVIVIHAAMSSIRSELRNSMTAEKFKSGSSEYSYDRSANLLVGLLNEMTDRLKTLLERHVDTKPTTSMFYIDSYIARQQAINDGATRWVGT